MSVPYVQQSSSNSRPSNVTTYKKAITEIRNKIKNASLRDVHIYKFNIRPDQLDSAHALLDKHEVRKEMRVTYSDDYNFIIRYMPSPAHEIAYCFWHTDLIISLSQLSPPSLGCMITGHTTFQLGARKKQADAGMEPFPNPSRFPSVVMEVGNSESMSQLIIDAKHWLEFTDDIRLVILISIDSPIPPFPNFPRIRITLWRREDPSDRPVCPHAGRERIARDVWGADWTDAANPFYILLSDIFRGPPPASYGNRDRVYLNSQAWRDAIISRC